MSAVPGTEIACQKDDSEVATGVYYGVDASFSSWPNSVCNPETGISILTGF